MSGLLTDLLTNQYIYIYKMTDSPQHIHIHGRKYDISNFSHPGGKRIIESYVDRDASLVFDMFHKNSTTKVMKYLNALPNEPSEMRLSVVEEDFIQFRNRLDAEGMFVPRPFDIMWRTIVAVGLLGGGIAWCATNYWLGVIVAGLGWSQIGWIEHEGGHGSFTTIPWIDKTLQWVVFDMVLGGSHRFWNYQHNNHHANTQHIEYDLDLDTHPLFCYSYDKFKHNRLVANPVLRVAGYVWPAMNCLVFYAWTLLTHPRYEIRKGNWKYVPMTLLFAFLRAYAVHQLTGLTPLHSVGVSLLVAMVGLSILLTVFVVSHITTETNDGADDLITTTANHTVNIRPNFLVNWFMGYLNLQIEHHLFPTMPQINHPKIRPRVKRFFAEHGLEYKEYGFFEAYRMVFKHIYDVSRKL